MIRKKSSSETQIDCNKCSEKCNRKILNMPSSSNYVDSFNSNNSPIIATTTSSVTKKLSLLNLRRTFADKSRKTTNRCYQYYHNNNDHNSHDKSLKNTENFKLKKSHIKCQTFDAELIDNPWITSGQIGSRDAVLVFRTSVFNTESEDNDDDDDDDDDGERSKVLDDTNDDDDDDEFNSDQTASTSSDIKNSLPKKSIQNNSNSIRNNSSRSSFSSAIISNIEMPKNKTNIKNDKSPKKRLHPNTNSTINDNNDQEDCVDHDRAKEDDHNKISTKSQKLSNRKLFDNNKENNANNSSIEKKDHRHHHHNYHDHQKQQQSNSNVNEMPAKKLKIKYKFMNTETKLLKKIFVYHGLTEAEDDQQFNILWTGVHIKPDILRSLTPYQRVNHFPRSYELTRKDRLYKNIVKMQHLRGFKHFDIVPQSFILPLEYRDLVSAHNKQRGPWIVKPAASSRGRGIFIVNSPDQIQTEEQVLVSKYIANPLCINGNKCDLRVYVVVTSFDPLIIYMYEEGLVRLATVKYELNTKNLWNPCMHLCNYSINKYHLDYIKSTDALKDNYGHKWTLSALLSHLNKQNFNCKQLMLNIEDLIIKSFISCSQSIISACKMFVPRNCSINCCFELYGFDILIDDQLKPWLLEINLSPSLGIDSPLDERVKASLITDLLTLVGIPAYTPQMRTHIDEKWTRFKGYSGSNGGGSSSGGSGSSGSSRRANSADHLNNSSNSKRGSSIKNSSSSSLSNEELRIVKNAKLQNSRCGGFVRIFPTVDSMQRYGTYLDPITGIPISIVPSTSGTSLLTMTSITHNFNQLLYNELFCGKRGRSKGKCEINDKIAKESNDNDNVDKDENIRKILNVNDLDARMKRYERKLQIKNITVNDKRQMKTINKKQQQECFEENKLIKKQLRKLIENGNELTQLQARQAFSQYLEFVLKRLLQQPSNLHEKLIMKFISRISNDNGGLFAQPILATASTGLIQTTPAPASTPTHSFLSKNSLISSNITVNSKDRLAMIAKLLNDFIQSYNRDTEAYIDTIDLQQMIPIKLFNQFLINATENDLEMILTLHTNVTQTIPFLYNRCHHVPSSSSSSTSVPIVIPTGVHGFLKALPNMISFNSSVSHYNNLRLRQRDYRDQISNNSVDNNGGGGNNDMNRDNSKKTVMNSNEGNNANENRKSKIQDESRTTSTTPITIENDKLKSNLIKKKNITTINANNKR